MAETKNIHIKELEVNKGQIEGLPQNPRFIKDERFTALKKSIEDAPEMLALRELIVYPHNGKFVIIAGNMRFRACKDLGYKEIPCKVLPEDTPVEKLREYTIKDNIGFGADDWDIIANEWDINELDGWGMELPDFDVEDVEDDEEEDRYTAKIEIPTYEPSEQTPTLSECIDTSKRDYLVRQIKDSNIQDEIKQFLYLCATRHIIFNYEKIADYYASQPKEVQELMEESALVLIDFNKAIENGFVELTKKMKGLYDGTGE